MLVIGVVLFFWYVYPELMKTDENFIEMFKKDEHAEDDQMIREINGRRHNLRNQRAEQEALNTAMMNFTQMSAPQLPVVLNWLENSTEVRVKPVSF